MQGFAYLQISFAGRGFLDQRNAKIRASAPVMAKGRKNVIASDEINANPCKELRLDHLGKVPLILDSIVVGFVQN